MILRAGWLLIILILARTGVGQAVPANVLGPPAVQMPVSATNSVEACYQFAADVGFAHLPAQLIVLPDRRDVVLKAVFKHLGALPAGVRECSHSVRWQADCGQVTPAADRVTSEGQAVLSLPPGSRPIRLRAIFEAVLARTNADGRPTTATTTVRKEADLELLAPVASTALVKGVIDGFKIGNYRDPQKSGVKHRRPGLSHYFDEHRDVYVPPAFFYKVTPEIRNLKIAPHQTLGFGMIDFPWYSLGKTQYIALDLHLVSKIEDLRELLCANGIKVTEFVPIYGFRPPAFNLGTISAHPDSTLKKTYSMHQYGRAIDLIIDENHDGKLDDLNGDGKIDIHDAAVIMRYVDKLDHRYYKENRPQMVGGAGLYTNHDFVERPVKSPYIHIDTRGFWPDGGGLTRWPKNWPTGKEIPWGGISLKGF